MEITLCDLRRKEVINIVDGRRLGRVFDIVIDTKCGKVIGIIVPGKCGGLLSRNEELFIPWKDICKIGDDVIIVELKLGCGVTPHHKPRRDDMPSYITSVAKTDDDDKDDDD